MAYRYKQNPHRKTRCEERFICIMRGVHLYRSLKASKHRFQSSSASISPQLVKELRDKSNAPILECKNALLAEGVNGDILKAMDWLRAKGIAKSTNQVKIHCLIALLFTIKTNRRINQPEKDLLSWLANLALQA